MGTLNLGEYFGLFPDALRAKYEDTFEMGFKSIDDKYEEVRSGRNINVEDVMAIFDPSLPYISDWTKPDRDDLEKRMVDKEAAKLIQDLGGRRDRKLIIKILDCFRELSLTSLVLHHVYPGQYSMCSHHIASLLYITGRQKAGTAPEYYIEYCQELESWGKKFRLNVVQTEFALWTWYRLANYGSNEAQREHSRKFDRDEWVRKRRADRIAKSLNVIEKMGFARFFLDIDPTLAAIIAWREFESRARDLLRSNSAARNYKMSDLIPLIGKSRNPGYPFKTLWEQRNLVMHNDCEILISEAKDVVQGVTEFIEDNTRKFSPR